MKLEISIEDDRIDDSIIKIVNESMEAVFSFLKINHYNIEICILFTNDHEIKVLNKLYRGVDKATNVLSFPCHSTSNIHSDVDISSERELSDDEDNVMTHPICILGSIAISYDTVLAESSNYNKSEKNHLTHLLIHSLLHLLGYDHEKDEDAIKMESMEISILKKMNIQDPYK